MPDPRKSGYIPAIDIEDLPPAADPTTDKPTDFELPENREPYVSEQFRRAREERAENLRPGTVAADAIGAAARTGNAMAGDVAGMNRSIADKGAEIGEETTYHQGLMDGRRQAAAAAQQTAQPPVAPAQSQEERLKALAQRIIAQRRPTALAVQEAMAPEPKLTPEELAALRGTGMGATDKGLEDLYRQQQRPAR